MHRKLKILIISLLLPVTMTMALTVRQMDNQAQKHFDKKQFSSAIALWLNILEIDPENERIQKKIEMIYELKQRKDLALQKSKLNYRIARKTIDKNYELGKSKAKLAINNYITAYRIDPEDPELQDLKEDMRRLNDQISAEEEKRRLNREMRIKAKKILLLALVDMKEERFEDALKLWEDILDMLPKDREALEGKRKAKLAIDNRIKYEKIKRFMAKGGELLKEKKYSLARLEYVQVINLDPENSDAREKIEDIDDEVDKQRRYQQRLQQAENFYASALLNIKKNAYDQAEEDLESALALIENYKDSKQRLKGLTRLRKNYDERERRRRLQVIYREFQDGILAYTEGNYRRAIASFEKTLRLDPKNDQARKYLQQAKDAQDVLSEEIVTENSPYYDIVNSLIISGKELYKRGEYIESRQKWDNILKLFPKNKMAIEYLLKCELKLNPGSSKQFLGRIVDEGKLLLKAKKYNEALKKFKLIRSIDAGFPGIAGYIAQSTREQKAAKVVLNAADQRTVAGQLKRAAFYYKKGGKDNLLVALRAYRAVIRMDATNVQAVIGSNKIEAQLRITPAAQRVIERRLTPRQRLMVRKYYYSGINYYTNNNFKKAIDEWRKVLVIDPGHVKAKNNIRKSLGFLGR